MSKKKASTARRGARSAPPSGYLPGVEIYEGYARVNPHNCAVKERTGDGVPVGPCCFYLENGTTCPRHGKVKADNNQAHRSAPTADGDNSKTL